MDQASISAITNRAAKGDNIDSVSYRTTTNFVTHVGEGAEEGLARVCSSRGESACGKGKIPQLLRTVVPQDTEACAVSRMTL